MTQTTQDESSIPSIDLLNYYRDQVNQFENERQYALKRFGEIEVSYEQLHKAKWDLHVKEEEISELQKGLSDANVYLFDEREQVLRLQAEIDQLKMEQMEDRRRIQHLLALTQPVKQEVTFFKDCRPGKVTQMPLASQKNPIDTRKTKDRFGYIKSTIPSKPTNNNNNNRILRTIYMPSERTDSLILTIESLQNQLNETQRLNEERLTSLLEDRKMREDEYKEHINKILSQNMLNEEELRKCQQILQKTTKDLLEERRKYSIKEREYNETILQLKSEKELLENRLNEVSRLSKLQIESIRKRLEKESELLSVHLKDELMSKDEDIYVLKEQYEKVQEICEKKLRNNENELRKWKKKYNEILKQRNLEFEGYTKDISYLRNESEYLIKECEKRGIVVGSKFNLKNNTKNKKLKNVDIGKEIDKIRNRFEYLQNKLLKKTNSEKSTVVDDDEEKMITGSDKSTTNNENIDKSNSDNSSSRVS